MELRNKRKGVPVTQQDSRPNKDCGGTSSKRVKAKLAVQPERSSRRLRNLASGAGPSSGQEIHTEAQPSVDAAGHRSDRQGLLFSQRVKQELPSEPDHVAEQGRQHVMAGSSGQAEQVRFHPSLDTYRASSYHCQMLF